MSCFTDTKMVTVILKYVRTVAKANAIANVSSSPFTYLLIGCHRNWRFYSAPLNYLLRAFLFHSTKYDNIRIISLLP